MEDSFSLVGKVALVTGAAVGIGRACVEKLAAAGARVMLTDIDEEACSAATEEIKALGYQVAGLRQDVTLEADWLHAVDATLAQFGGLDILVNNAGISLGGTLVSNTLEEVRRIHQVNVDSIFLGMKYAAEAMRDGGQAGKGGSIINLSSVAGLVGIPGHTAYGSTKGAVRLYTKHAAVEFARLGYGVRVNSVHPGLIETAMGDKVFSDLVEAGMVADIEQAREFVLQMTPMGRLGKVDDIANMVLFLASDAAGYCTGAEFVVDGGVTAC